MIHTDDVAGKNHPRNIFARVTSFFFLSSAATNGKSEGPYEPVEVPRIRPSVSLNSLYSFVFTSILKC